MRNNTSCVYTPQERLLQPWPTTNLIWLSKVGYGMSSLLFKLIPDSILLLSYHLRYTSCSLVRAHTCGINMFLPYHSEGHGINKKQSTRIINHTIILINRLFILVINTSVYNHMGPGCQRIDLLVFIINKVKIWWTCLRVMQTTLLCCVVIWHIWIFWLPWKLKPPFN